MPAGRRENTKNPALQTPLHTKAASGLVFFLNRALIARVVVQEGGAANGMSALCRPLWGCFVSYVAAQWQRYGVWKRDASSGT